MSMETAKSSGLQTADAVITARPAKLQTAILIPAAADSTLILYDNATAASGTVLLKMFVKASVNAEVMHLTVPVEALNGIYADVTGAAAEYIVHYSAM